MNTTWITVALTAMLLAVAPNLHAACSNASLRGTYGYSSQGFVSVTPDISPALFLPQARLALSPLTAKETVRVLTRSTRRMQQAEWAAEPLQEPMRSIPTAQARPKCLSTWAEVCMSTLWF